MKITSLLLIIVLSIFVAACGSAERGSASMSATQSSTHPGTDEGATALVNEFVKPGADHAALTKKLRPTSADYAAVFEADLAKKAETLYGPAWDAGQLVVAPKTGQTEVKVGSATSDEMKSWSGPASEFPEGWRDVASQLKPGVKIYRFKFVEPGKDLGMAFEGLAYVNGQWRIFPKPWRANS